MNGIQQGILEASRQLSTAGGRVFEAGGHDLGAWDITWIVLGLLLWAAAMTALVMGMIALVRHLKKPKEATPKSDEPKSDEPKEDEPTEQ